MILDDLDRAVRGTLAPQLFDNSVGRDRLVRVQEQQGEEGALLAACDGNSPIPVADFERSEDPKFHCLAMTVTPSFQPPKRAVTDLRPVRDHVRAPLICHDIPPVLAKLKSPRVLLPRTPGNNCAT